MKMFECNQQRRNAITEENGDIFGKCLFGGLDWKLGLKKNLFNINDVTCNWSRIKDLDMDL